MSHSATDHCEPDEIPVVAIYLLAIFLTLFVGASIIVGVSVGKKVFSDHADSLRDTAAADAARAQLQESRAALEQGGAAAEPGRVRLPIEDAKAALVNDPRLLETAFVPPAAAPPAPEAPTTP